MRPKGDDYAIVHFTTRDGHPVSAKVTVWKALPAQADHVTICYAPSDPDTYAQDARICPEFSAPRFQAILATATLAVLTTLWLPHLIRATSRRRARSKRAT